MNPIIRTAKYFSKNARDRRAKLFRNTFALTEKTKILDFGSETGSNIHSVLSGTRIKPENVYIADIDGTMIEKGFVLYGFNPVLVDESSSLPFPDKFFDIVYCSSVIEHVTVPKERVWRLWSGKEFRNSATLRQAEFALEIQRLGNQYFCQTPYRYFPIESHSWLPFLGWLPRRILIPVLKITNSFWVKKTSPDWYLLDKKRMSVLFPEANLVHERSFGLTKSIMAVKQSI